MTEPSLNELQEAIEELTTYQQRLKQDVIAMGQKLRLPKKKVDSTLEEHPELQRIEEVLSQLIAQRDKQSES
ncbi:MAG: hypothetical protein AB8A46_01205 [Prochlorococcus sp.]|jgi:predicted  nucleic acid-binding Zn-ribbon protein|nr:hypothetical protein [Prochlorococcus sp.]CAI8154505.1 MAG: Uncharacterised protein [Prochlorococcus marinus str. MIT 9215]